MGRLILQAHSSFPRHMVQAVFKPILKQPRPEGSANRKPVAEFLS